MAQRSSGLTVLRVRVCGVREARNEKNRQREGGQETRCRQKQAEELCANDGQQQTESDGEGYRQGFRQRYDRRGGCPARRLAGECVFLGVGRLRVGGGGQRQASRILCDAEYRLWRSFRRGTPRLRQPRGYRWTSSCRDRRRGGGLYTRPWPADLDHSWPIIYCAYGAGAGAGAFVDAPARGGSIFLESCPRVFISCALYRLFRHARHPRLPLWSIDVHRDSCIHTSSLSNMSQPGVAQCADRGQQVCDDTHPSQLGLR